MRALAAAGLLLSGLVGGAIAPARAAAWSGGACPTRAGLTVVVDFSAFDAGVVVRCVPGTPSSGLEALDDAGHSVAQVATMPGFVCRIDMLPGEAEESCATTPPATAYWSYWTATRGGSWAYSPVGAAASRPGPGTVEGWAFTDGGRAEPPSVPPPALVAPTPPPTAAPTARPTQAPAPRATPAASVATTTPVTPAAGRPSATATAAPTPADAPTASAARPSHDELPSPTASPTTNASPRPVAATTPGGSGPLGTIVGIGLIVAVGGAAVASQRRLGVARHG